MRVPDRCSPRTPWGFITPRQLAILIAVAENEGLNQTEAVKGTGIDRSTWPRLSGGLVHKGILQHRRTRQDSRAKVLRPTDDGRRLPNAAAPEAQNVDALLLAVLPTAQRKLS